MSEDARAAAKSSADQLIDLRAGNQLRSELDAQSTGGEQALGGMATEFARDRGTLRYPAQAIRLELEKRT